MVFMRRLPHSTTPRLGLVAAVVLTSAIAGCRQDMQNQPKFLPLRGTTFFADGRSARTQVPGTVARSQGEMDSYFLTGLIHGKEGDGMPIPVTITLLARGQERYNIYCSPCHSRVGNGEGMIVQRGYFQAADFQSDRLRQAPLGHFVNVILNGYGAMPSYAAQVQPVDRWAIAAYIRALQLSQSAKMTDAPRGAAVLSLKQIAMQEGLPESFAQAQWGGQAAQSAPILPAQTTQPGAPAKTGGATTGLPASPREQNPLNPAKGHESGADQATHPASSEPAGDPAEGKTLYAANCQMCHQASRAGNPPAIPSLIGVVPRLGKARVREVVANGIPGGTPQMPSFGGRLSQAEISDLIAYLQSTK